jgi:hypothetical protein
MRHQAVVLDADTAAWLAAERAARGAARALAAEERIDARSAAQLAAIRAALDLPGPDGPDGPDADPEESGAQSGQSAPDPETPPTSGLTGPMTVKDAVRTALDSGVTDADAVLRFVHERADANAKASTVERYLRLAKLAG